MNKWKWNVMVMFSVLSSVAIYYKPVTGIRQLSHRQKYNVRIKRRASKPDIIPFCNQTCPVELNISDPSCAVLEEENGEFVDNYRNFGTVCHMRTFNCEERRHYRFLYRGKCLTLDDLGFRRNIRSKPHDFDEIRDTDNSAADTTSGWRSDHAFVNIRRYRDSDKIQTSSEENNADLEKAKVLRKSLYVNNMYNGGYNNNVFRANRTGVIRFDPRNLKQMTPKKIYKKIIVTKIVPKGYGFKGKGLPPLGRANGSFVPDAAPLAAQKKQKGRNVKEEEMKLMRDVYPMVNVLADASIVEKILH